jgi:hypothetical protein
MGLFEQATPDTRVTLKSAAQGTDLCKVLTKGNLSKSLDKGRSIQNTVTLRLHGPRLFLVIVLYIKSSSTRS